MPNATNLRNNSGVILITVILLTIVLSIVAVGIMSLNVSQVKTSKSVVDSVVEEQLATGLFYQDYQRKFENGTPASYGSSIQVGTCPGPTCRRYTINRSESNGTGANNTNAIQFNLTSF